MNYRYLYTSLKVVYEGYILFGGFSHFSTNGTKHCHFGESSGQAKRGLNVCLGPRLYGKFSWNMTGWWF